MSGKECLHISDHFLTYALLRTSLQAPRSKKITFWSLKNYDTEGFLIDLDMVPFRTVMNDFDDIDDKLYAFESLFHTIIDQHAPLKQAHVRGGQVPCWTMNGVKQYATEMTYGRSLLEIERMQIIVKGLNPGKVENQT